MVTFKPQHNNFEHFGYRNQNDHHNHIHNDHHNHNEMAITNIIIMISTEIKDTLASVSSILAAKSRTEGKDPRSHCSTWC